MKKYYFITYSAINKASGARDIWNDFTDLSPADYWLKIQKEGEDDPDFHNFVLHSAIEVTEEEYLSCKDHV
ncbi:hypothetical protein [Lewinella sp. W8]|uniref:hypothetical protein n=1 Tax=Lewinella sp. W8 TaxID=2528208 RepID=UPI001068029A|nr:hypothetical protein [Lewinella sp. W8]MTB53020.1 hypothetical protein [Lewinella sp. W8]